MKLLPAAAAGALLCALLSCSSGTQPSGFPGSPTVSPLSVPRVLLFTKTLGFKHASIPEAVSRLQGALAGTVEGVDVTDDAGRFTDAGLRDYDVVVFLLTTGDVLTDAQQATFERFISSGKGFAGVHSATDTEYAWAWYHELVGATFKRHPKTQKATVRIEDGMHASTGRLPAPWVRTDEWYDFRNNPRSRVHVLATVDESTYSGGTMGRDHPIEWCRSFGGGRSWYTAMGHGEDSWRDPVFLSHVARGIVSAAGGSLGC